MFSTPLLAAIRFRRWKQHRGLTPNVSRSVVQSFGNIGSREFDHREITVDPSYRSNRSSLIDYTEQCVIWRHFNFFSRKIGSSFFLSSSSYCRIIKTRIIHKIVLYYCDILVVSLRRKDRVVAPRTDDPRG